jgi:hypothetical protein
VLPSPWRSSSLRRSWATKKIGLPPVIIVGGAGTIGFVMWYLTYLWKPIDARIVLPLFALTVAGLQIHIVEEYLTGFGPAMSRIFNISWTEKGFVIIFALVGPTIYTLTMIGLYFKVRLAGFIAWFIFIGPGFAEFTHFIFPLIQPAIEPTNLAGVSQVINGTLVADMPNYYLGTTGNYYFSGMWTAVLPMIPGSYAIYRLIKEARKNKLHVAG